ncbi:MAG: hypothetical protein ACFFE8_11580 [Candidatus Heimdallarchaeota archaeon]
MNIKQYFPSRHRLIQAVPLIIWISLLLISVIASTAPPGDNPGGA